jgi:hypothetical protein
VLGVLYESFIHPITILSTLPSAGVGALLALMLFRQDLSVVAIIGIILLIGIVKKNGIMMVDFALEAEREHGKNSTEAIFEASLLRFRPIMMTTMAALLAGIPLALGTGLGSELRRPLGIAMVGGLLLSQAPHVSTPRRSSTSSSIASPSGSPAAVRPRKLPNHAGTSMPRAEETRCELLLGVHPAAGGHHAAHRCRGHRGRIAFMVLPVAPLPQVDFPTISVSAGLPGASAAIMAASVATPLERQLRHIAGITEMTSSSSLGSSQRHDPVRFEPRHRRRRAGRAGSHQRCAHLSAGEPAQQSRLPEGESLRCADHDSRAHFGQVRRHEDLRPGLDHPRAEAFAPLTGSGRLVLAEALHRRCASRWIPPSWKASG